MHTARLFLGCLVFVALFSGGCASAPEQTTVPSLRVDEAIMEASFEDTWKATRQVLRDLDYEIYTRDKRGLFVAYTKQRRRLLIFPHRVQLTVVLESISKNTTRVSVETVAQQYRVTLLTYPDWRDNINAETGDEGVQVLEALQLSVESS